MRNIHRFGNEFWVDETLHSAAKVNCDLDIRTGKISFSVSYGSHGSGSASAQMPYGYAIVAACEYAKYCATIFRGKSYDSIKEEWALELEEFHKNVLPKWKEKK